MIWIYISLPILLWLCLLLPYNLKRSGCVSVLQSVYYAVIPTKKRVQCSLFYLSLLFCLLLLGINQDVVLADETPTPTFYPLYVTQTPSNSDNYNCPDGQPSGFGTVTPNPQWLLHCGQCLTPEPSDYWPTDEPSGTVTPEPTEVPEGFPDDDLPTLRSVASEAYYKDDNPSIIYEIFLEDTEFRSDHDGYYYMQPEAATETVQNIAGYYYAYHEGRGSAYEGFVQSIRVNLGGMVAFGDCTFTWSDDLGNSWEHTLGYGQTQYETIMDWSMVSTFEGEFNYVLEIHYEDTGNRLFSEGCKVDFDYTSRATGDNSENWNTIIWNRGYYQVPQDVGMCAEINGEGEGEELPDDDIFSLPEILVGNMSCFSIGGFNIPLGWLETLFGVSAENIAIPSIEICFVPLIFGSLNLFGLGINMDLIASAMAGILLIRIITRS